jgi:hypothetical protein
MKRVLAISLIWLTPFIASQETANAQVQAVPSDKLWQITYLMGPAAVKEGKKLGLTIGKDTLLLRRGDRIVSTISVADIRSITSTRLPTRRPGTDTQVKVLEDMMTDTYPYALLLPPLALPGIAFSTIFTVNEYRVTVVWLHEGTEKALVFRIPRSEYSDLILHLQEATGLRIRNLEAEWVTFQKQLAHARENQIPIWLERRIQLGEVQLDAGLYQLAFFERGNGEALLYFFAGGKPKQQKLAAVAVVQVLARTNGSRTTEIIYREEGHQRSTVSEIRLPAKTFRFGN